MSKVFTLWNSSARGGSYKTSAKHAKKDQIILLMKASLYKENMGAFYFEM